MNRLSVKARAQILSLLCEGMSMRAISRVADCSINTVSKLLVEMGQFCSAFHDERVQGVTAQRVQCDEVWSFTYAKERNVDDAKAAPEWSGRHLDLDRHRRRQQAHHLLAGRRSG